MAGKIIIDSERCKGCGLCVMVCPHGSITLSDQANQTGYFPAVADNTACTGCAMCALICPDAAIEVFREENRTVDSPPTPQAPLTRKTT